ncbi:MAK10-like protein, partial [Tanacetum coccineum]
SNWLECLLAGSISTWEDLTTRFLAQFFPPGRTAKLRNDILMFQQHHGESLSEAWTRFKDLLQKVPHHGIDLWLQVQIFYDHVNPVTKRTIDQSAGGKLRDLNAEEFWALLEDPALYDNESWNEPRDFAKPVKAIALPQDVPSTSDRRLIELKNQVQCLMETHLAPTQPTLVNKITTSCEICSGPHDTQYCMEDPERAFVEYASSRTDEAGDARLTKFEADFKRKQGEMTNKIDTMLKVITDQIAGALPSDTVKNPKLGTHPVSSARSYPTKDPQCLAHIHSSINTITIHPKQPKESQVNESDVRQEDEGSLGNTNSNPHLQPNPLASIATEQVQKLNSMLESLGLVPRSSDAKFICSKEDDGEVMFIEIIRDDEPQCEDPNEGEGATTKGPPVEYFDTFPTRDELTYHRIKGMHVFVGNFTYIVDFMIIEDISSIIDLRLTQVILGKPFIEISNMTHDQQEGVVRFINENDEVAYKMPHKIEQYNSLSNLEKENTKSVYLRNEEDKRRGVEYVMSKILGFYKERLELGPEYLTGVEDEREVT